MNFSADYKRCFFVVVVVVVVGKKKLQNHIFVQLFFFLHLLCNLKYFITTTWS